MTREELEKIIGDGQPNIGKTPLTTLANIGKFVNVVLRMDRHSLDYYYSIKVDELLASEMPAELFSDFKKDGWAFSEDKSELIKYLTI